MLRRARPYLPPGSSAGAGDDLGADPTAVAARAGESPAAGGRGQTPDEGPRDGGSCRGAAGRGSVMGLWPHLSDLESGQRCDEARVPAADLLPALRAMLRSVEAALAAGQGAGASVERAELNQVAAHLSDLLATGGDAAEPTERPVAEGLSCPFPSRPEERGPSRASVLAISADAAVREPLVAQLRAEGLDVVGLPAVDDALRRLERGAVPDLLIVDLRLPEQGAATLSRQVRDHFDRSELPILLLASPQDELELAGSGVNDFLVWPLGRSELMARVRSHLEIRDLSRAYNRFVPREFLRFLKRESIVDVRLGDYIEREMTVMFLDIRSFTSLSESMTPEQNFNFLNSYLQRVAPVIKEHGGFIDKYVGDGIMALFPERAADALHAAVGIRGAMALYNRHRASCNYRPIEVGIGIHTGRLILGTIGHSDRMETTVISDAVNLASRLESLNKLFGTTAVVSESSLAAAEPGGPFAVRYLGRIRVTGRSGPVPVFDLFQGDPPRLRAEKEAHAGAFEDGVRLYEQGELLDAAQRFGAILAACPEDRVARHYQSRCVELAMALGGPEPALIDSPLPARRVGQQ